MSYQIERNEADLAVYGITCTYGRGKVGLCSPPHTYAPVFFFSRFPLLKTKIWIFFKLLTPVSWMAYLISISCVILFLKLSHDIGKKFGLQTIEKEVDLMPFR